MAEATEAFRSKLKLFDVPKRGGSGKTTAAVLAAKHREVRAFSRSRGLRGASSIRLLACKERLRCEVRRQKPHRHSEEF
ncbi:hypothetical protein HPP92_028564 [Vanilla planifolia]|uniref:Uncharacterized protein n=1 Tax=Vanilla planifolia TaxID=51239 RepID=A0A835PAK2_VANPL|nr:hypothetical protein HPP92_028564 [Vanilla planifolia]KAG0446997.1 hypothetical protein HPP92_028569 [Vanilla planifolia]